MDNMIFYHLLFDQFEGRTNGPDNEFRWDGEGWIGTDMNKLWIKSEGFVEHGRMSDGDQEVLYDRPIPYLRYFDFQAGIRYDLDSDPGRTWGAIGIEGLAPYFFEFAPTFYFSNRDFLCRPDRRFLRRPDYKPLDRTASVRIEFLQQAQSWPRDRLRPVRARYGASHPLRDQPEIRTIRRIRVHRKLR